MDLTIRKEVMLRLLLKEKAADKLTIIKIKAICFQLLSTTSVSSFAEALGTDREYIWNEMEGG